MTYTRITLLLLAIFLGGCAARKPAIKPGADLKHPALTHPVGKATCKTGLLKLFGSYGWHNCKNEEPASVNPTTGDGHKEVWEFPCWPEKNEAKCLRGCR